MKKIHWFHLGVITFLLTFFYVNSIGPDSEAQVIIYFFLTMMTIAYIIATIVEAVKE